jgi:ADP-ribose pyrophosphatase YjhB (NUDIX family)
MELQVGVKVLLENEEGKYLLLRRSAKKYPETGEQWDMVGGRIDPGTTLMENLAREVDEESGLSLEGSPRLVAAQDILRVPGRHVVRLTYLGRASGELKLSEEHDAYRWFSLAEIEADEKGDPYLKEILAQGVFGD